MKSRISQILISIFVLVGTALFINGGSNESKKVFDLETLNSTTVNQEVSSDSDFEISFSSFGGFSIANHLNLPFHLNISKNAQQCSFQSGGQGKLYILFHQLRVHSRI